LADSATPTLEDLRDAAEAAWLWDSARARVAWANAAGLAFFDCSSLFEIVDRPFDAAEPGVARIAALARTLSRGQAETVALQFPSTGRDAPVSCRCTVHALSDGRPGILAVAVVSEARRAEALGAEIRAAFDLLPVAALLTEPDGTICHLNAASRQLLRGDQRGSLAALLGDASVAEDLLMRTEAAGTVSMVRSLAVRLGQRDLRVTLRRLQPATAAPLLVLLDDITDRRLLERALQPKSPAAQIPGDPPAALTPADADAFEKLGQVLNAEVRQRPERPAAGPQPAERPRPEPAMRAPSPAPARGLPHIPAVLRGPLDRREEPVLICKDGKIAYGNPSACRLFGFDEPEDLINDAALTQRFGNLAQSLPATEFVTDGGHTAVAAVQVAVVPWHGGPARRLILRPAAATEVQAPKAESAPAEPESERPSPPQTAEIIQLPQRNGQAEADDELRAILDTASDGIITLDAQSRIHSFSAGAEAIFGYRIAEVAGKSFADFFTADSQRILRDYLAALQGPGLASVFNDGREVQAIVKQGGTVPLFLTIGKLQAPRSQAAFCAVVRDITQWKKTEAELREAKEKAEATSRQKSEFLARISHELRTPLNAIMGFSEVMRLARFGEIENEKYRGYVNDIHASGSHLLSLINDLLDIAKVEAGKLELNFTAVNLGEVIDHAMKMLQEQATAARVVLRKAWPAGLPNVVADLRSMRQILLNLLSNAVKFTDPGGEVIVSGQLTPAGEMVLRVKDTGIGMNEDQLRAALEPFRRVVTEGREAQGTGLGLPLTKALTEANRASFTISSEPRKGTLAEITFPTTRVLAE
jgi:PAS domain S-box-containing protein